MESGDCLYCGMLLYKMLITAGNQPPDVKKYCCAQYRRQDIDQNSWNIPDNRNQPGKSNLLHFKVWINIEHIYHSIATKKLIDCRGNHTAAEIEEGAVFEIAV